MDSSTTTIWTGLFPVIGCLVNTLKRLKGLKPFDAIGPDSIPAFVLKAAAADEVAPILTRIYQTPLDTGQVPSDWRDAWIVPVFKKGDKIKSANYRPVSLTWITCKLMEHIVNSNVMAHLDQHSILKDSQHGFRKKRSCETQLVITIQEIASRLSKGSQEDIILLDFAKSFDEVPHSRLLYKIEYYGIQNKKVPGFKLFWGTESKKSSLMVPIQPRQMFYQVYPRELCWCNCYSWPTLMICQSHWDPLPIDCRWQPPLLYCKQRHRECSPPERPGSPWIMEKAWPRRGGSNEYPQSVFLSRNIKQNIGGFFLSENFQFLEVKLSTYLNRRVFVMTLNANALSSVSHLGRGRRSMSPTTLFTDIH